MPPAEGTKGLRRVPQHPWRPHGHGGRRPFEASASLSLDSPTLSHGLRRILPRGSPSETSAPGSRLPLRFPLGYRSRLTGVAPASGAAKRGAQLADAPRSSKPLGIARR